MSDTLLAFSTIDVPGADGTVLDGINNAGQIVGFAFGSGDPKSFLDDHGTFSNLDAPGATFTEPRGINEAGQVVGDYQDFFAVHAFRYDPGGTYETVDFPRSSSTRASGINAEGQIVGSYGAEGAHGFVEDSPFFVTVDYPGSLNTTVDGINDAGQVVGAYNNGDAQEYGFLEDHGTFSPLDIGSSTHPSDINNLGGIAGSYVDGSGLRGFFKDGGAVSTVHVPGSSETQVFGINDLDQMVGTYRGGDGVLHGFEASPLLSAPFGAASPHGFLLADDAIGTHAGEPVSGRLLTHPGALRVEAVGDGQAGTPVQGRYGTLIVDGRGRYSYTPTSDPQDLLGRGVGIDRFPVSVVDRQGDTAQETLSVAVLRSDQTYSGGSPGETLQGHSGSAVLDGTRGNQTLRAARGDQVLIAGPNDHLVGGRGPDTFVFEPNCGAVTLSRVDLDRDAFVFDSALVNGIGALLPQIKDTDHGVAISDGLGDRITIDGVTRAQLLAHRSDFHLV